MILKKLKEATREQHDGLESAVDVLNSEFSKEDYERVLTKFYRFYKALEPKMPEEELSANGFDQSERRKLPALEKDLKELGIYDQVESLPDWDGAPSIDTTPKAFGAAYVMEGATLGGQVIGRSLRERLGITPENGGAFFYSYGPLVGPKWKAFGEAITNFSENNSEDDQIIQSAKDTFDSFKACFTEDIA